MSEVEKLQAWLDAEVEKGLLGIHLSVMHGDCSVETLAGEVNAMLAAPECPDEELF